MIDGAHVIVYSHDADADRAFFRDVLEYPHVDAGGGWLVSGCPAAAPWEFTSRVTLGPPTCNRPQLPPIAAAPHGQGASRRPPAQQSLCAAVATELTRRRSRYS
jgi:hypothetical protein